jgi:hypothetical protein
MVIVGVKLTARTNASATRQFPVVLLEPYARETVFVGEGCWTRVNGLPPLIVYAEVSSPEVVIPALVPIALSVVVEDTEKPPE